MRRDALHLRAGVVASKVLRPFPGRCAADVIVAEPADVIHVECTARARYLELATSIVKGLSHFVLTWRSLSRSMTLCRYRTYIRASSRFTRGDRMFPRSACEYQTT